MPVLVLDWRKNRHLGEVALILEVVVQIFDQLVCLSGSGRGPSPFPARSPRQTGFGRAGLA